MSSHVIYDELSISKLKELLKVLDSSNRSDNTAIIIKFGATWCGPCQKIKSLCYQHFNKLPNNVICFDLDIDDNLEIYVAYKAKKMVPSIPTIIGYINKPDRDQQNWYAPDVSVIGSAPHQIDTFFKEIQNNL